MSGSSGSRFGSSHFWTVVGSIAGVVSVIVAIVIAVVQSGSDDKPQASAATPAATSSIGDPTPVQTPTRSAPTVVVPAGSDADNDGIPNESAGGNRIGRFEIVPRDERKQVGDHEFLAMPGNKSSFGFNIKTADGYDIPKCTVRGFLVYSTGAKEPLVSSVNCPSQSVYTVTQNALKPGSYKIVATAFVPETGEQAQAEYDFTVVPSS